MKKSKKKSKKIATWTARVEGSIEPPVTLFLRASNS
jgi:hypothetical protein